MNYRIIPESMQRRACLVQDRDPGEAVADGNRRIPRHNEIRMASRSMLSFISG